MSQKKGQGLPINVVILAALALVVLLVLFGILTGKIKWFGKGLSTCPGECLTELECSAAEGYNLGGSFLVPEQQKSGEYSKEGATCAVPDPDNKQSTTLKFCCSARKEKT